MISMHVISMHDLGLDHNEFSLSMMIDGTLPTLPSMRTLHFAILVDELCHFLKSLYATCA